MGKGFQWARCNSHHHVWKQGTCLLDGSARSWTEQICGMYGRARLCWYSVPSLPAVLDALQKSTSTMCCCIALLSSLAALQPCGYQLCQHLPSSVASQHGICPVPFVACRYPDRDRQRLFFEHYMADPSSSSSSSSQAAAGNAGLAQGSTQASSSSSLAVPRVQLSEEQLDAVCAEANVFALASHVYWGVWAIVQARYSPIDFDYMSYSSMRWAEFHRRKEEFVGQARAVLVQRAAAPAALAAVG